MAARAWLLALLLGTVAFAGCVGGDDPSATNETELASTNATGQQNVTTSLKESSLYSYDSQTRNEVRWENSSMSPAEACFVCGEHRFDVSGMLPANAPALLEASVTYNGTFVDPFSVSLNAEGATVYDYEDDFDNFTAVLAPTGTGAIEVVVEAFFPDTQPSMDYQLRIEVTTNRTAVPAGVPIAFDAPSNPGHVTIDPFGLNSTANAMVWDGNDRFLGHFAVDGLTTLNLSEGESEPFVVLIEQAEGIARFAPGNATTDDPRMKPLGLKINEGTPKAIPSGGNVSWTFTPEQVPISAGMYLDASNPNYRQGVEGQVSSPNGTLVSFEQTQIGFGFRQSYLADYGTKTLTSGEYRASLSADVATEGEAAPIWVTYQR